MTKDEGLFISEPKKPETHYSIYEDSHGTHIFANNDVNLMNELTNLYDHHYRTWKLDGLYTPGENFVAIAPLFAEAKAAQTLHDVRSAMQINYFDDNSLIK